MSAPPAPKNPATAGTLPVGMSASSAIASALAAIAIHGLERSPCCPKRRDTSTAPESSDRGVRRRAERSDKPRAAVATTSAAATPAASSIGST